MHEPDQEKTAFITLRGIFCYKIMPFWLKSDRATYQRMITKMFESIMDKTMDAYINDMVVKSKKESNHVKDLTKVFAILKRHKPRLNAMKCTFEVGSKKFLGYLVTRREIKANLEQIVAINNLVNPRTT